MILALALTSLLSSNIQNQTAVDVNPQGLEILNVLLQNPEAYAELRRCGQPQVESASIEVNEATQSTRYTLNGSHLTGDIIQGTFTLTIDATVKDPELNWISYSHAIALNHESYSKCASPAKKRMK